MWNERGYAAIAMDNTGFFPTEVNAGKEESGAGWKFGLPSDLEESGYVNAPNNDGMASSVGEVSNMWMYHAVKQAILANNILRADERVDSSKIGVTGISWGGVIASIAVGYDNRFAFAIPIYGSGYIDESLASLGRNFSGASTRKLWLAQDRFDKVDMPILWLCWNDDTCFSINSNSKSYLETVKNNADTRISMLNKMYHSHKCGWTPEESMAFADSIVKGTTKLTAFSIEPTDKNVNIPLILGENAVLTSAEVYYITNKMSYTSFDKHGFGRITLAMEQNWQIANLAVSGNNIVGTIPEEAVGYYIEVKTTVGDKVYITTSAYIET